MTLGWNRIDPNLSASFRGVTARSAQQLVLHFMKGSVLEYRAGPTVIQTLARADTRLLSAVAQVSLLDSSHESQSVGPTFTHAIEEDPRQEASGHNWRVELRLSSLDNLRLLAAGYVGSLKATQRFDIGHVV